MTDDELRDAIDYLHWWLVLWPRTCAMLGLPVPPRFGPDRVALPSELD